MNNETIAFCSGFCFYNDLISMSFFKRKVFIKNNFEFKDND
jgi:hypothetical protein